MILEALKQQLIDLLIQTSGSDNLSVKHIETPPQEEWGDFSFPCFVLAKETKKDPKKMAETIVSAVFARKPHFLEQVTASGSYVNFTFAAGFIGEKLFEAFAEHKDKFGESQTCANKKVMIEFSQPNTHKEFHIGHLRNVLLGDALTRLYRASGCWVLAANYIGDFGMHVATCLWALKKFHTNEPPPKEGRAKWLGKIYAEGANAVKDNELFKQEVKDVLLAMQTRDAIWFPLFLETKEWSMKGFRAIYDELGVVFDDWFYESDLYDDGKRRVDGLLQTGVAKKSEGAVIVDLKKYGLDIFVILKSGGSFLYSTNDLALAYEKFKRYDVDTAVIVTDVRQAFYFKQLFKTLELAGFKNKLRHVGYEFVRLSEGAMASRLGNVVLYEDLRDKVLDAARRETKNRHSSWDKLKIDSVSHLIALAAIKFDMLAHDPNKMIVFDPNRAVSFDGFTGPYIQYTIARIKSIFRKKDAWIKDIDPSLLVALQEKKLMLNMARFPNVIETSQVECNPAILCRYVYDLARNFSVFYETCPVLSSEEPLRSTRLQLCSYAAQVLGKGLELLGIPLVEEM